jgi:hypothetical protein
LFHFPLSLRSWFLCRCNKTQRRHDRENQAISPQLYATCVSGFPPASRTPYRGLASALHQDFSQ